MIQTKSWTPGEKRILRGCLLGMLLCLLLLFLGDRFLWNDGGLFSDRPQIGTITFEGNDVRRRGEETFVWYKAGNNDPLRAGDSVFSGSKSKIHVNLQNGGTVEAGENSLIAFRRIQNLDFANLIGGDFKLNVDGKIKIAIGGEVVTLDGKKSVLEISFDGEGNPSLKLLKGEMKVGRKNGGTMNLDTRHVTSFRTKSDAPRALTASLFPAPSHSYVWHLYDLYEQRGSQLRARSYPVSTVRRSTELKWSQSADAKAVVQTSPDPEFKVSDQYESLDGHWVLDTISLGKTFWRVSLDAGKTWSVAQSFSVTPGFLSNAEPSIPEAEHKVLLESKVASVQLEPKAPVEALGYVVEASLTKNFDPAGTKLFWSAGDSVRLSFYKSGTYFYRFRSVNKDQELSQWSSTQTFHVVEPPPAPKEPELKLKLAENKTAPTPKPAPLPKKRQAASAENQVAIKVPPPPKKHPNDNYVESRLSIQGFLWTLQSTQQYYGGTENPVASGLGVYGRRWYGSHGIEASLKAALLGLNQAGNQSAIKDLEVRYHYRFVADFPLEFMRSMQTSLFLGYEMYRNSGEAFSSQYDLMKFGTSLEFPLWERWSSGGEVVLGQGPDGSSKKEISGFLNYFLSKDWSIGAGYRVHLFDAGSPKTAAGGELPYREGYTEGYSILNYYF